MQQTLILIALLMSLAVLRSEEPVEAKPTAVNLDEKAERLRQEVSRLKARLDRPFDSERLAAALAVAAEQISAADGAIDVHYGSHSLLVRELVAFRAWNGPTLNGPAKGGPLDFSDPGNALHIIVQYARELESHGIDFLVVPVPTRLDICPERLPGIAPDEVYRGGNRGMLKFFLELARNGVETVDLYSALEQARDAQSPYADSELYRARNSHWTPLASLLAADAIAAKLVTRESHLPGSLGRGVDFLVREERRRWDPESASGEDATEFLFQRVLKPDGTRAFEPDRSSDLLLLGDSFALNYRREAADLASQLFARLERPFDVIALRGGALSRTWSAVARRRDQLAGKRLVVWELTSGALTNPKLSQVRVFED